MSDTRLMPLARAAVSSWSALNRPNTSSVEVSMAIGSANTQMNGINSPMDFATTPSDACRLTSSPRISLSTSPSNKTNVNTSSVMTRVTITWRRRYSCSVLKVAGQFASSARGKQ